MSIMSRTADQYNDHDVEQSTRTEMHAWRYNTLLSVDTDNY